MVDVETRQINNKLDTLCTAKALNKLQLTRSSHVKETVDRKM